MLNIVLSTIALIKFKRRHWFFLCMILASLLNIFGMLEIAPTALPSAASGMAEGLFMLSPIILLIYCRKSEDPSHKAAGYLPLFLLIGLFMIVECIPMTEAAIVSPIVILILLVLYCLLCKKQMPVFLIGALILGSEMLDKAIYLTNRVLIERVTPQQYSVLSFVLSTANTVIAVLHGIALIVLVIVAYSQVRNLKAAH